MKRVFCTTLLVALCGFATSAFSSVTAVDLPSLIAEGLPEPDAIVTPFNYNGTTVGGPTFNRPLANGNNPPTALSGVGTAVSYDVITFSIATSGTYNFLSLSVTPANWDNFTFLYLGSFNPSSPLTNVLIGNDDNPTIGRSGFSYNLVAGSTYAFVTTGFANTDAGTFNNSITQAVVPEPSAWAVLSLGAVGACVVALRRRQRTA